MNQSAERQLAPEQSPGGAVHALADGALDGIEAQQTIDLLLGSAQLRETWAELHWVGDSLRSEEMGALVADRDFLTNFQRALAAEPTVLSPRVPARSPARKWLRYGVPTTAAVVASAVVWMSLPNATSSLNARDTSTGASPSATMNVAAAPAVDPALLGEYLAAHQEYAATSLHGPGAIQAASYNIVSNIGRAHP